MKYIIEINNETLEHTLKGCMNPNDVKQVVNAIKNATPLEKVLEDIKAEMQTLRGCSCSNSDGIIDDVEDIVDNHISGKENEDADSN